MDQHGSDYQWFSASSSIRDFLPFAVAQRICPIRLAPAPRRLYSCVESEPEVEYMSPVARCRTRIWLMCSMASVIDAISLISLYLDVCITSNVFRPNVALFLCVARNGLGKRIWGGEPRRGFWGDIVGDVKGDASQWVLYADFFTLGAQQLTTMKTTAPNSKLADRSNEEEAGSRRSKGGAEKEEGGTATNHHTI